MQSFRGIRPPTTLHDQPSLTQDLAQLSPRCLSHLLCLLTPLPSHKELISFLQKKLFPKKLLVLFPHPTFPLSKHRPTLLTLPTILSAAPELKLTPDFRQPHFSPYIWSPFPWGITPLKSILTRSLTVCLKVCFPSLLVKSYFLVPCDTSIDPVFRIDGGILSLRASAYHRVTSPCCVMWLLVTGLKERRMGRVSCLLREVVYHSRLLIIAIIKQSAILSLSGSLSLIVV
jgi:hypothetical protein